MHSDRYQEIYNLVMNPEPSHSREQLWLGLRDMFQNYQAMKDREQEQRRKGHQGANARFLLKQVGELLSIMGQCVLFFAYGSRKKGGSDAP